MLHSQGIEDAAPAGLNLQVEMRRAHLEIAAPLEQHFVDLKGHALPGPQGAQLGEPPLLHALLQGSRRRRHLDNAAD
jgi:hypothetical protein